MRKIYRNLGLAVGALAVLAAVGPGLAASIAVPEAGDSPAAGQGAATVQGFAVTDIDWIVNDADMKVTKVSFTISRSATGAATVSANAAGNDGNAVVRVRLEKDATTFAAWQGCAVTNNGAAVCELAGGAQMDAAELGKVNIIAFDRK